MATAEDTRTACEDALKALDDKLSIHGDESSSLNKTKASIRRDYESFRRCSRKVTCQATMLNDRQLANISTQLYTDIRNAANNATTQVNDMIVAADQSDVSSRAHTCEDDQGTCHDFNELPELMIEYHSIQHNLRSLESLAAALPRTTNRSAELSVICALRVLRQGLTIPLPPISDESLKALILRGFQYRYHLLGGNPGFGFDDEEKDDSCMDHNFDVAESKFRSSDKWQIQQQALACDPNELSFEILKPPESSGCSSFLCSLCGKEIEHWQQSEIPWRDHVFEDLCPYFCTYPSCEGDDVLFADETDWLEHEAFTHRTRWHCPVDSSEVFQSSSELEDHLRNSHRDLFGNAEIKAVIPFAQHGASEDREFCPICFQQHRPMDLAEHLSAHFKRLALLALPNEILVAVMSSRPGTFSIASEYQVQHSNRTVSGPRIEPKQLNKVLTQDSWSQLTDISPEPTHHNAYTTEPYNSTLRDIQSSLRGGPMDELYCSDRAQNVGTPLDARFRARESPKKFFRIGRVFRSPWAEPAGPASSPGRGSIIFGNHNEPVFSDIKIFVVVEEAEKYCIALRIDSHMGRGCNVPGVIVWKHAIVYTGNVPPKPLRGENDLLKTPIRVNPDTTNNLEPVSRMNFGKLYTFEHNIPVESIGQVHQDSMDALTGQLSETHRTLFAREIERLRIEMEEQYRARDLDRLHLSSQPIPDEKQPSASVSCRSLPIHKIICGTGAMQEEHAMDYRVQEVPSQFFTAGIVFTILSWTERLPNYGTRKSTNTTITDDFVGFTEHEEPIFEQRCWFVVIKEGSTSCLCLRIHSFQGQGVPVGMEKSNYSIVHTTKVEPELTASERPTRGNLTPLKKSVRIKSEVYEVKHDVMARAFGVVHKESRWTLKPLVKEHFRAIGQERQSSPDVPRTIGELPTFDVASQQLSSSESGEEEEDYDLIDDGTLVMRDDILPPNCPPPVFQNDERVLLPGKDRSNARARFKPARIHSARLVPTGYQWEYSLKNEKNEGRFAPGQFFKEERLIKD